MTLPTDDSTSNDVASRSATPVAPVADRDIDVQVRVEGHNGTVPTTTYGEEGIVSVSLNPEATMVTADGVEIKIPLNVDGRCPSKYYDHQHDEDDPSFDGEASFDFDLLADVDLDDDDTAVDTSPSSTTTTDGGTGADPIAAGTGGADAAAGGAGAVLERVHVHVHGLATAGLERATQAFNNALGNKAEEDNNIQADRPVQGLRAGRRARRNQQQARADTAREEAK